MALYAVWFVLRIELLRTTLCIWQFVRSVESPPAWEDISRRGTSHPASPVDKSVVLLFWGVLRVTHSVVTHVSAYIIMHVATTHEKLNDDFVYLIHICYSALCKGHYTPSLFSASRWIQPQRRAHQNTKWWTVSLAEEPGRPWGWGCVWSPPAPQRHTLTACVLCLFRGYRTWNGSRQVCLPREWVVPGYIVCFCVSVYGHLYSIQRWPLHRLLCLMVQAAPHNMHTHTHTCLCLSVFVPVISKMTQWCNRRKGWWRER